MIVYEDSYEICNCKKVTVSQIKEAFLKGANTLRKIQDETTAGTECRHCVFPEADFGRIKKKIYCKEVLDTLKEENNG